MKSNRESLGQNDLWVEMMEMLDCLIKRILTQNCWEGGIKCGAEILLVPRSIIKFLHEWRSAPCN